MMKQLYIILCVLVLLPAVAISQNDTRKWAGTENTVSEADDNSDESADEPENSNETPDKLKQKGEVDWNFTRNKGLFPDSVTVASYKPGDFFEQGRRDARKSFHSPVSTVLGVLSVPLAPTVIVPVSAIANVSIPSKMSKQRIPDYLMSQPLYVKGYKKGMINKKIENTGKGIAITLGVLFVSLGMSPMGRFWK